jgi:hypothetical protein
MSQETKSFPKNTFCGTGKKIQGNEGEGRWGGGEGGGGVVELHAIREHGAETGTL